MKFLNDTKLTCHGGTLMFGLADKSTRLKLRQLVNESYNW